MSPWHLDEIKFIYILFYLISVMFILFQVTQLFMVLFKYNKPVSNLTQLMTKKKAKSVYI